MRLGCNSASAYRNDFLPCDARAPVSAVRQRWSLDSIDWCAIRHDAAGEHEALFYLVVAASFMESATDRYTANLMAQFRGDTEVAAWLEQHWLPEELQHGRALRHYAQIVWPRFQWDRVYASFLEEFSTHCCAEELEPTRTREMASRCVVEMGTASYYTALSRISRDPVLSTIARRIADDEIRHYKHFYRYFCRFQQIEPENRRGVFTALLNRLRMIDGQDSFIATKYVYRNRHPGEPFDARVYRRLRRCFRQLIGSHFPHRMCVQMLLKPLDLSPQVRRIALPMTETLVRWVVL
jgi:hypothetical protein